MNRRSVVSTVAVFTLATAVVAATAASAAPAKKKPIKGSYQVTATPDPTVEGTDQAGMDCMNLNPTAADKHAFTVPAAGTLHVVLDSANVGGKTDWDLYLLDAAGKVIDSSHGPTAHEETLDVFTAKKPVTIKACNLIGEPSATVTYTFNFK
jgi:hypothetical protein